MLLFLYWMSDFYFYSKIEHQFHVLEHGYISFYSEFCSIKQTKDMKKENITIKGLADRKLISVDYSDDDIIIIDNIKQLAEPNPTRIQMNLVAIVKKGKGLVQLGARTLTLCENQVLICPPNTIYNDFMFSPDFEFKAMFITNNTINSFLREKMNIWTEIMYVYKMHVVTIDRDDLNFFYSFYDTLSIMIKSPSANGNPYRTDVIQGMIRSLLLGLCGVLKTKVPMEDDTKRTQADLLFEEFMNLVNNNQTKSQTVEDFASELCVTPKYLTFVCKKNTGKTANEWIREHILEEIRYYLKQTDLSMKEISSRLGFANPSFFGKYVKEHFGMTPLQFRQK